MDLGTPLATKVVGTVGLLAVAALGWTFGIGPETGKLADAREQVTTVQDQNAVLAIQLSALVKQQAELGATRRTARLLAAKFPPTADQPGLFEIVTAAAVDAGIGAKGVTTLTPTPPLVGAAETSAGTTSTPAASGADGSTPAAAGGAQLARQTVTVSITGSYDQTQQLLVNLEQMKRAYLVTTVSLAGDASTGSFTTTITGDMFVMPPVPDPGKTVEVSSTTTQED
jgi:Tfp pilus assembly protein PilO